MWARVVLGPAEQHRCAARRCETWELHGGAVPGGRGDVGVYAVCAGVAGDEGEGGAVNGEGQCVCTDFGML